MLFIDIVCNIVINKHCYLIDIVTDNVIKNVKNKKDQTMLVFTMIKQINGRGEFAYFKNLSLYIVDCKRVSTSSN
jgi:hypothetical protein